MDELSQKIYQLQYDIRYAINKSGLPVAMAKLAVQSINSELLQIELNNTFVNTAKGSESDGNKSVREDGVGE
jgi:hypothetical protein